MHSNNKRLLCKLTLVTPPRIVGALCGGFATRVGAVLDEVGKEHDALR